MKFDIVIAGAGASTGFLLAFLEGFPAYGKYNILVLDRNKEPFRKIYASGNGRCNFSNTGISMSDYYSRSASPEWFKTAFESARGLNLAEFFFNNGIPSYSDEYGRLMPFTNSAKTIGDFFKAQLKSKNIEYRNYSEVVGIENTGERGFQVSWQNKNTAMQTICRRFVYACGGAAYPQLGADSGAFKLLEKIRHTVIEPIPGIVPIETKEHLFHSLEGLKLQCSLSVNGYSRKGELLFTKYGISGPNTLYASNTVSTALVKGPVALKVDFLPEEKLSLEYFRGLYKRSADKSMLSVFGGVLNPEFLKIFAKHTGLASNTGAGGIEKFFYALKNLKLTVLNTRSFKEAQVSLGGVAADEVNPTTFESRLHKNLYILGEALDFTGGCGGHNIHWCAVTAKGASLFGNMLKSTSSISSPVGERNKVRG